MVMIVGLCTVELHVITSYSIHYTKLYEEDAGMTAARWAVADRARFPPRALIPRPPAPPEPGPGPGR